MSSYYAVRVLIFVAS